MIMSDIKKRAKELGISVGKMTKAELIKAIQNEEGNFDCFNTATSGECDQLDCCWKDDCLK